jgi:hypothetical protein
MHAIISYAWYIRVNIFICIYPNAAVGPTTLQPSHVLQPNFAHKFILQRAFSEQTFKFIDIILQEIWNLAISAQDACYYIICVLYIQVERWVLQLWNHQVYIRQPNFVTRSSCKRSLSMKSFTFIDAIFQEIRILTIAAQDACYYIICMLYIQVQLWVQQLCNHHVHILGNKILSIIWSCIGFWVCKVSNL